MNLFYTHRKMQPKKSFCVDGEATKAGVATDEKHANHTAPDWMPVYLKGD